MSKQKRGVAALFHSSDLSQTTQIGQSVTLLLRRIVQRKTQWHSNVLKLLKLLQKSSQAFKTFFQLLQIKRLQLKLTNTLQNSYPIQSQHQVPRTGVKQHPKTPQTTKTNENPPRAGLGKPWSASNANKPASSWPLKQGPKKWSKHGCDEGTLTVCLWQIFVVPSGTLSARTGESAKLPVRARLSSFRSLCAVFRGGT